MPGFRSFNGMNEGRFDFLGTARLVLGRSNNFLGSKAFFYGLSNTLYGFSKIFFSGIFFFSIIGLFYTTFFPSVDFFRIFLSALRWVIKADLL